MTLTHQFVHCSHCKNRWPGLRYTCPYCNWPAEHTDVTPAPVAGLVEQPIAVVPVEQAAAPTMAPVATPYETSLEGSGVDPILVVPVPQAAKMIPKEPTWEELLQARRAPLTAAALSQPQVQPQVLAVAPDEPVVTVGPVVTSTQAEYEVRMAEEGILIIAPAAPATLDLSAFDAPKAKRSRKKAGV